LVAFGGSKIRFVLSAVINFIIVAFVLFLIIKGNEIREKRKDEVVPPPGTNSGRIINSD